MLVQSMPSKADAVYFLAKELTVNKKHEQYSSVTKHHSLHDLMHMFYSRLDSSEKVRKR